MRTAMPPEKRARTSPRYVVITHERLSSPLFLPKYDIDIYIYAIHYMILLMRRCRKDAHACQPTRQTVIILLMTLHIFHIHICRLPATRKSRRAAAAAAKTSELRGCGLLPPIYYFTYDYYY